MPVTVLIVDDSKLARIVAGKALAELRPEWRKLEAGGAAQALEVIAEQRPDIALIDFNMADKDGLELAAELRVALPEMPIAIITANIQDEIIARARSALPSLPSRLRPTRSNPSCRVRRCAFGRSARDLPEHYSGRA